MNLQSTKPGDLLIATVAERNPAIHVNDHSDYVKIRPEIKLKSILSIHRALKPHCGYNSFLDSWFISLSFLELAVVQKEV